MIRRYIVILTTIVIYYFLAISRPVFNGFILLYSNLKGDAERPKLWLNVLDSS